MSSSFQKQHRLLDKHAYSAVFNGNPIKAGASSGMVFTIGSQAPESRLGVIVAKKNVRHATQRNRIKRVVREYFRVHPLTTPTDMIFLARHGAASKTNSELRQDLSLLWQKLERRLAAAS